MAARVRLTQAWLCALLGGVALWASVLGTRVRAEIPEALRGQPIVGVRIGGDEAQLVGSDVTGVQTGDKLDRELVRRAVQKLLRSGRWVDVQVEAQPGAKGVSLVFHLEPRINLRRVEVRGQDRLDAQVVRDALGVSAGSEVRVDALPSLEAAVRRAYAERGYLSTRAAVRFRDTDNPAQKVLLVEIDEGGPVRIAALRTSGDQLAEHSGLFATMGLAAGDVLNRRTLGAALVVGERHLRSQYYLEARLSSPVIAIHNDAAVLTFPLHLGPRYKLEVHGATPLRDSELAAAVLLVDAPLTAELIDAMPARIKDLYAKNGFLHARASVSRRLITPKHARLLARIDPGQQVAVSRVRFPNAVQFSNDFLREQLASYLDEDLPGGGLIAPVDSEVAAEITHGQAPTHARQVPRPQEQSPEHTYYEPTYEQAIKHITELYQAAGYLAVQVGPPVLRELDKLHAAVEIPVVEGPRTVVHSLVLHGQERVSAQELLITAGILRGAPFSYLLLEEARVRLQELYQERGHVFVRIEPSVRFSSDRTRAEVSVQIVEGFAVNVGEIVVRGAERTSVDFIRSLLALKPGDVFRPSLAHTSERTLSMLGVMQGISVQLEDPDLPARVKRLIVNVSERSNQFLDFSAGLSTGQGARAGFDYGYRNLFGHAVGLTLRVQFAYQLLFVRPQLAERFDRLLFSDRLERNVALGLVIPRTPGLGATRANLDLVHVRDNERDFGLDKNGITLGFTENPWQRVTLLEAADLENNNIDVFESGSLQDLIERTVDPRVQRLLRVPEGNTTLVALRMSLSYDQRDSPFVPTTGYFVSLASELASTLRVEDSQFLSRFLKLQVTGSGYIPVGRSIVIAGQVRVGRIVHLAESSETYPNRAFFLGGVETMRGYYQDELIPQDLADAAFQDHNEVETRRSIVRSGDAFVLLRGEVRFPIYGQLGGGLFADFGNLWKNAASMNPLDLRPTAGAGLRLSTPVGPIAVDYGIVLVRRVGLAEPFGTLHFSIGLF